ncbi:MAG: hypothetical protein ACFCGT_06550 [Sandaracinaceae bacterium]
MRLTFPVLGVGTALALVATLGCGSARDLDDAGAPSPDAGVDGGPLPAEDAGSDDAGVAFDAATSDAGRSDAGLADEGPPDLGLDAGPDAGPDGGADLGLDGGPDLGLDAGPDAGPDAGSDAGPDAGPPPCGTLGQACGSCDPGQMCEAVGAGRGVCVPANRDCGGFGGAVCPAARPHCLMGGSASAWSCATDAERNCVCATRLGMGSFPTACP